MSDYEVRPATMRDAKAVAEVHTLAAQAAYQGILPEEELRTLAPATREAKWREAIEFSEPQVQVAVLGSEIVGFVGFDRSRDPKTPSTAGEIWALYVRPEHWGKGIGVALWDAAREGLEEEGCTTVTAWVPIRNDRAMRFFELAGFKREMKTAKTTALGTVRVEEIRLKRNVA
ncbi:MULTISPECIES: GNAT family N-acetyltransferase [Variovorax]|uniref:GNAT family N-acetyltransferase n=1 Tax=Variovorax TaxID=34072 RepID=UPI00285C256E|nr:GNAT family N-acetyltransferase [Variovorax sp. 3319]MDR6889309.1 ribosomal protein S18 acetylase RimI-like enzyme [Variovorax sp. 3319]